MTKLTDITPEEYRCPSGDCPAIYRTPNGKLVIIGERYTNDILANRVGINESAIIVPADMIKRALSYLSEKEDN